MKFSKLTIGTAKALGVLIVGGLAFFLTKKTQQ
jgi:hypothetical protein